MGYSWIIFDCFNFCFIMKTLSLSEVKGKLSGVGGLSELRELVANLELADLKPPATANSLSANSEVLADQVMHDLKFADYQKINKVK